MDGPYAGRGAGYGIYSNPPPTPVRRPAETTGLSGSLIVNRCDPVTRTVSPPPNDGTRGGSRRPLRLCVLVGATARRRCVRARYRRRRTRRESDARTPCPLPSPCRQRYRRRLRFRRGTVVASRRLVRGTGELLRDVSDNIEISFHTLVSRSRRTFSSGFGESPLRPPTR